MTKYEFGVMSQKWELEAKNDDVAFFTMVMLIAKPELPIAIYEPFKKTINGMQVVNMDNVDKFIGDNKIDLQKSRESIKKIA